MNVQKVSSITLQMLTQNKMCDTLFFLEHVHLTKPYSKWFFTNTTRLPVCHSTLFNMYIQSSTAENEIIYDGENCNHI